MLRLRVKILWAVCALAVLVLGAALFFVGGPRNLIGMLRYDQRREGDLKVGDRAPDVALSTLDGRATVRLSEFVGERPLVLIFGSFT